MTLVGFCRLSNKPPPPHLAPFANLENVVRATEIKILALRIPSVKNVVVRPELIMRFQAKVRAVYNKVH